MMQMYEETLCHFWALLFMVRYANVSVYKIDFIGFNISS